MLRHSATLTKAGLGFRVHSGWAAAVAVVCEDASPRVVDRRHIEICDPHLAGARQPFHAVEGMDLKAAERKLQQFTDSTNTLARLAIKAMVDDLASSGWQAVSSCILLASGRQTGSLESILGSHAMIHTAEGEFFREAVRRALEHHQIPVVGVKEREIFNQSSSEFEIAIEKLQKTVADIGKSLGPPWRQDEKLATLAGWFSLSTVLELKSRAQVRA